MKKSVLYLIAAISSIAIIFVCPVFAQNEPNYAVALTELDETVAPAAKVSNGSVILAIVESETFDGGAAMVDGEFEVFVPKKTELCIFYHTRNGLYEAKQFFYSDNTGWIRVHYKSKTRNDLRGYGEENFAVQVQVSDSCIKPLRGTPLTLVRQVNGGSDFFVIVHSDGQPANIEVYQDGTKVADELCGLFKNLQSVRFDRKCKLPPQAFATGARTALIIRPPGDVKVHRIRLVQSDSIVKVGSLPEITE